MNNLNKVLAGVLLALVAVLGFTYYNLTSVEDVLPIVGGPSGFDVSNCLEINGVKKCYVSGSCNNASTTLVNFVNPQGASSTITAFSLWGENGTTTVEIVAGTTTIVSALSSYSATTTGLGSANLIDTATAGASTIATGTEFYFAAGSAVGPGTGFTSPGSRSLMPFVLGPSERIFAVATGTHGAMTATELQGITGNSNTFTCKYAVEMLVAN